MNGRTILERALGVPDAVASEDVRRRAAARGLAALVADSEWPSQLGERGRELAALASIDVVATAFDDGGLDEWITGLSRSRGLTENLAGAAYHHPEHRHADEAGPNTFGKLVAGALDVLTRFVNEHPFDPAAPFADVERRNEG